MRWIDKPAGKKPARDIPPAREMLEALVEAELERLCKKHRINRRRCGLFNFDSPAQKWGAVNLISKAEKYPGCLPEFLGYLRQDPPLPDAGSFIAILWAAVESYKRQAGEIDDIFD